MPQIPDQTARDAALNIHYSYIVQAPAGSGKTSLLTQRYLALLAKVQNPEEIVAITFTKKAAGEMQERIIEALMMAKEPPPSESYLLKTYLLAKDALAQNELQNWHIFENKYRLRILTIDAFCLLLTNRMPLLSKAIPYSFVADDPDELYRSAAEQMLKTATKNDNYQQHLELLQTHLGNNHSQLIYLFVLMLQKREQWLPHVLSANHLDRDYFDAVLHKIHQSIIAEITSEIPFDLQNQIENILQYQSAFIDEPTLSDKHYFDWSSFPQTQKVANLLLSNSNSPRKRFTKKEGFPSASSFKTTDEKQSAKDIKQTLGQISQILEETPRLLSKFQQIKLLPAQTYTNEQWQVLEAMLSLLPLLAAELSIIFSQTTNVDFSEISMQALHALGDETPTDLALYLDYEIHHLLIDEFQDTSKKQFRLLERLTESWFHDDGKSLFLVGDPMQSIYRFREADVGLFLSIQHHGINQVDIKPLKLTCNFRSSAGLVNEVNQICQKVFPIQENIEQGAVTYSSSDSLNNNHNQSFFGIKCIDREQEANYIKQYILQHPEETIAILVRSRAQLKHIVPTLNSANIQIEGVNLENLTNRYTINILLSITRLILNPNDFLSLSEILASPLCGIAFDEIEKLLKNQSIEKNHTLESLLNNLDNISIETQNRVRKILHVFIHNQSIAYRNSISQNTHRIWQYLNGDHLIPENERNDIEKFWQLLTSHDRWPFDLSLFERQLSYRFSEQANTCKVKIMTIHRSKGLEFDTVILPSIDYSSNAQTTPLLNWLELPETNDLLLSPIHSVFDEKDPLGNFIQSKEKQKEGYERQRLFYVAITRAKTKLTMIDTTKENRATNKNSFLSYVEDNLDFLEFEQGNTINTVNSHTFKRLDQSFFETAHPLSDTEIINEIPKNTIQSSSQIIGEFIHQQLFYIAQNQLPLNAISMAVNQYNSELLNMGLSTSRLPYAHETLIKCLSNIKKSSIAQWILSPKEKSKNELQLNTQEKHFIVDRTFIENNVRWIIDYKITDDPEMHIEQYHAQLNLYASLFKQMSPQIPIKLMLYYPLIEHHICWDFSS